MDSLTLICDECGGTGSNPGSLYEPEECKPCAGGGKLYVEIEPLSSQYPARKPMARELASPAVTGSLFDEPGCLAGER